MNRVETTRWRALLGGALVALTLALAGCGGGGGNGDGDAGGDGGNGGDDRRAVWNNFSWNDSNWQ